MNDPAKLVENVPLVAQMTPPDVVRALCEQGRLEDAWNMTESMLNQRPHDANALILASFVCWKLAKMSVAYHLGVRATQLAPHECTAWLNLGIAAHELWLIDEAIAAYKTAMHLSQNELDRAMASMNLSAVMIDTGKWEEAERFARQALRHNPSSVKAKANLGFALLARRKWEGWTYYGYSLGMDSRIRFKFRDEPDWDGAPGKIVVIHGEQGLGDELSFASMIPDAIRDCKRVIIDCDRKLTGLFKRSFPRAKVYGTRTAKAQDNVKWDEDDWALEASCAMGELGKFYRMKDESFTGDPYLVADPIRRTMWRKHFDGLRLEDRSDGTTATRPAIGIAWTGGIPRTGAKFRTLTLTELTPLLQSIDAHWVSLQYKDASREIATLNKAHPEIDLVQYPWATLTRDYDDTAALLAELDMVISMQTAVCHLAGALGKECWVLLPKNSQWRYGERGEAMIWYKSLKVFQQRSLNDWHGPIGEIVGRLRQRGFPSHQWKMEAA